jgi:hypothetical protein
VSVEGSHIDWAAYEDCWDLSLLELKNVTTLEIPKKTKPRERVRKVKVSVLEVMAVAVSCTAGAEGHAEVKCRHSQVADSARGIRR